MKMHLCEKKPRVYSTDSQMATTIAVPQALWPSYMIFGGFIGISATHGCIMTLPLYRIDNIMLTDKCSGQEFTLVRL